MSWTSPSDLRRQVQRLWDRGEILAGLVKGEPPFPRRLVLKGPTSAELPERFDEARAWIASLQAMPHCRVAMRPLRHRVLGANELPGEVWIDTLDDAVAVLGRRRETEAFRGLAQLTRAAQPRLLDWIARRPLRLLELAPDWPALLRVVDWLAAHPRPGVYLRQVDVPGVHTKLIEAHRGVLMELLDAVLPPDAVDPTASGVTRFARRYGFRERPERIRFRILDPRRSLLTGGQIQDVTLDAPTFAGLGGRVSRVLITENEVNFLALPPMRDTMAVFGAGYGLDTLGGIPWLPGCRIHYWGDIDTHGFAILDELRGHLPGVESVLMDRRTLMAFESQWGSEGHPTSRDLTRLRPEEAALYDDLRDHRIRRNLRLEQERIGFGWVMDALERLG